MGYNWFDAVPGPVTSLRQLEDLDISYNRIGHLPDALASLSGLRRVVLSGNPFLAPYETRPKYEKLITLLTKQAQVVD
jgi:Leucine-rich repeat (LRR) protein